MNKTQRRAMILDMARAQHQDEGTCEIDDNAKISEVPLDQDGDNGCYVAAWVWVDFSGTKLGKEKS